MDKDKIQEGDIIQIVNPENAWFPALLIVSEVKSWGVQAYLFVPKQGKAFYRIDKDDFAIVGIAEIVEA